MEVINENTKDYVTFYIGDQVFGLEVLEVQDVFKPTKITKIPQSSDEVFGVLNLRGRIVTVIDLYRQLGLNYEDRDEEKLMNVVVEYNREAYAIVVDRVWDVKSLPVSAFESIPRTMHEHWKAVSKGIYKLDDRLLIVLDVAKALSFIETKAKETIAI